LHYRLFEYLQGLSASFYSTAQVGDVTSCFAIDVPAISTGLPVRCRSLR
jgi:hypothetical protein